MKGIVLAGGSGTRLYPACGVISKQALPVYDKPMVYYAISTLMLGGIREIQIISSPQHITTYEELLGDGQSLGVSFNYIIQEKPAGLSEALILSEDFVQNDTCCLILGDNFYYGHGLADRLKKTFTAHTHGAIVFGYKVIDPSDYGVLEVNGKSVVSIEEKPAYPRSDIAATGMYLFDAKAANFAKSLEPSPRGELEITDLLNLYLEDGCLSHEFLGRGYVWLDLGRADRLLEASQFVQTMQNRQGLMIGYIEEIALNNNWARKEEITDQMKIRSGPYAEYVTRLFESAKN